MKSRALWSLAGALLLAFPPAHGQEFPTAPPNLKEMEAKGLPRLSADELKAFFPGVIETKGVKGKHFVTHNPDGTFLRKGFMDKPGQWRIDEKNNTHCKALQKKKGYDENCFATFRAPDGIFYFDYDVSDGFYAHTWRKAVEQ